MLRARDFRWPLLLLALFTFRLWFGLCREFFFQDETQIFLIGFRYYATGQWPFFGPDVVWTKSEIPGALQGLLVGLPLRLAPYPESPYVLLAALSFAALCAFAWYVQQHRPSAPRWLVWGWLLTIPWTIEFSGHLINTSYILPASLMFFLGFFESVPMLSLGRVPPSAAQAMMGAALTWLMQIHMSWPLLLPFVVVALVSRGRPGAKRLGVDAAAFAAGAALPALLLAPTLIHLGSHTGSGGVLRNVHLHPVNPWIAVTTLARFFAFASLEIVRFIATDGPKRLEFFQQHLWLAPLAAVVFAVGVIQPLWMLLDWIRTGNRWPEASSRTRWQTLRLLVAATVAIVYASYWFVMEPAQAHAFYVLAPMAFLFAAYWWTMIDSPRARRVAAAVLAVNVVFHAGLAWSQAPDLSLYRNRSVVAAAIRLKEPEMFGHRRAFSIGGGPAVLSDAERPYDPARDMEVVSAEYRPGPAHSLHWTVTLHNASDLVAFRDPLCVTTYRDASGAIVDVRDEQIRDIFEPGDVQMIEVNNGYARAPFASATVRIAAAEALLPVPQRPGVPIGTSGSVAR